MVIYSTQLYTLDIKIILAALTETGARSRICGPRRSNAACARARTRPCFSVSPYFKINRFCLFCLFVPTNL